MKQGKMVVEVYALLRQIGVASLVLFFVFCSGACGDDNPSSGIKRSSPDLGRMTIDVDPGPDSSDAAGVCGNGTIDPGEFCLSLIHI